MSTAAAEVARGGSLCRLPQTDGPLGLWVLFPRSETITPVKSRMVCPKCGKPLTATITRVEDENGQEQRHVHYRCPDNACDGEVENPSEFRAFVRPAPPLTLLARWLAAHRSRPWTPFDHEPPGWGGGFAILSTRR